jgi:hypothetical protein
VPRRYQEDVALGIWVDTQRERHRNNKMRLDRKELLDEIGFVWKVRVANTDTTWNAQYEKLVEFKQTNGHCIVPRTYQEDMTLGRWVTRQRRLHSKNTIRLDRKVLLDEIGFVWKVDNDAPWKKQHEKLVEFKQKNGHCHVPRGCEKDVSLGMWVSTQRGRHLKNKLRLDRKKLLDELGFAWKANTIAARSSTTKVSCR